MNYKIIIFIWIVNFTISMFLDSIITMKILYGLAVFMIIVQLFRNNYLEKTLDRFQKLALKTINILEKIITKEKGD